MIIQIPQIHRDNRANELYQQAYNELIDFQDKANSSVIRHDIDLWNLPTYRFTTGGDCEYVQVPNYPNRMITTQIALSAKKSDCIVLEHPSLCYDVLPTWDGRCIVSTLLGWNEIAVPNLGFDKTGKRMEKPPDGYLLWEYLMFFAPSDTTRALFNDFELNRYIQRYFKQDARIRVETDDKKHKSVIKLPIYLVTPYGCLQIVLKILDLGKLSLGSLEDNVKAFGGVMPDKSSMNKYKTNMLIPYGDVDLLPPYLDYGKDDACELFFLRDKNIERTQMLFDTHNLEIPDREIVTTGSLVAELFQSYLDKVIGNHKAYESFTVTDKKGNVRTWKLEDMLKRSTVEYFAKRENSKKSSLALVQGGRAKNELPLLMKITGVVADIDKNSAYATVQQLLIYPVGLPSVYGTHESSKKEPITLGKFLKWKKNELSQRLYVIVVNGTLQKEQTLVPSKVIDTIKIIEKYNDETCKIPADFRLYTKELINGVITSDILETLRNTCSNQEWNDWMNLTVTSAAWYSPNLRCDTPKEWYEKNKLHTEQTGNSVEEVVNKDGTTTVVDKRSRYWLAVPLKNFLEPYAKKRQELKAEMKLHTKDTPEYDSLNAQQTVMKLVGNTNYGVLASPYFPVSNVVIANNITAAVRAVVWCTQVALRCVQIITDGGAYDLNKVRYIEGRRKPSLYSLSMLRNPTKIDRRLKIVEKPLGNNGEWSIKPGKDNEHTICTNGTDTYECKDGTWQELDEMALDHVREFFRNDKHPISILETVKFEHKDLYQQGIFHGQTNYRFTHSNGTQKLKARGSKVKGTPYEGNERARMWDLCEEIEKHPYAISPYRKQYISQILKCNQANEMLESKSDNIYKANNLLPGDSVFKQSWVRPLSLSMFHWQSDAQYDSWSKTSDTLKNETGWGLEQYFLNEDGTFNYVQAVQVIQDRIDDGHMWLYPLKGAGQVKGATKAVHPYLNDTEIEAIEDKDEDALELEDE